jgi:acetyl-CoA C-acetyltransferase
VTPRPVYVVAARRTPIGRAGGALRHLGPDALAAACIEAVLLDVGADGAEVDEVILGNVWGPGGNPARLAALRAGLGIQVPGSTVDVQCASGLAAINTGARLIATGGAELCLAGGVESVSTAPWRASRPTEPHRPPRFRTRAAFTPDGWPDPDMGPAADALAARHAVSRARQDAFAARSHRLALAAAEAGHFDAELVAIGATPRRGGRRGTNWIRDESPRARFTATALARLGPLHGEGGTVTAGNTAPINDGAAVVALMSAAGCERLGVEPRLRLVDGVTAGVDPAEPGAGPVAAVRRLLTRTGIDDAAGVDRFELTEAFAGQALACLDLLGRDPDGANLDGGALALGHPWGASGAVLVTRLFTQLVRGTVGGQIGRPGVPDAPTTAIAAIAGAGGIGVATLFERVG